ncbi:PepSY-associated TM helix domain-containing protein [Sphingopyxis sp. NJF-3]
MKNRQALLTIHRWLGLALALLLVIQGGTGIAMVFRDEIEPVVHPELRVASASERLSMQHMFDTVQAAHPDASITRAEIPQSADQAVLFKLKRRADQAPILTAIDPYRGGIVRDGDLSAWPVEWLFVVHEQLLAGPVGEYVIGFEGIVLFVMSATGLWFWWPGRKRFKSGFRVAWRGNTDLRWRTLHRAAGAAAGPILLVTALTGVLMVWKEPLRDLIGAAGKPTPAVAEQAGRPLAPLDDLVARARVDFGGTPLRQIRFSSGGRVVAVYLDSDRSIRPDGTAQYYFNGYDGALLATYIAGEQSTPSELIDWIYTVHTGLWGGWFGRLLLLAGGVVLVGLALTGPWLWYSRRLRRKPSRARPAPAHKAPS